MPIEWVCTRASQGGRFLMRITYYCGWRLGKISMKRHDCKINVHKWSLLFATRAREDASKSIGYGVNGSTSPPSSLSKPDGRGWPALVSRSSRRISVLPRRVFGFLRPFATSVIASRRIRCCVSSSFSWSGWVRLTKLKLGPDERSMVLWDKIVLDWEIPHMTEYGNQLVSFWGCCSSSGSLWAMITSPSSPPTYHHYNISDGSPWNNALRLLESIHWAPWKGWELIRSITNRKSLRNRGYW